MIKRFLATMLSVVFLLGVMHMPAIADFNQEDNNIRFFIRAVSSTVEPANEPQLIAGGDPALINAAGRVELSPGGQYEALIYITGLGAVHQVVGTFGFDPNLVHIDAFNTTPAFDNSSFEALGTNHGVGQNPLLYQAGVGIGTENINAAGRFFAALGGPGTVTGTAIPATVGADAHFFTIVFTVDPGAADGVELLFEPIDEIAEPPLFNHAFNMLTATFDACLILGLPAGLYFASWFTVPTIIPPDDPEGGSDVPFHRIQDSMNYVEIVSSQAQTLPPEEVIVFENEDGTVTVIVRNPNWTPRTEITLYDAETGGNRIGYPTYVNEHGEAVFIINPVDYPEVLVRVWAQAESREPAKLPSYREPGEPDELTGTHTITVTLTGQVNTGAERNADNEIWVYFTVNSGAPQRATAGANHTFTITGIPHGYTVEVLPPHWRSGYSRDGANFNREIFANHEISFRYHRPSVINRPGAGIPSITYPPLTTVTIRGVDEYGNEIYRQTVTNVRVDSRQTGYAPDLEGFILRSDQPESRTITVVADGELNVITFIYVRPMLERDRHFRYVFGFPDGTIRPEAQITREEVATIFFRLLTTSARNVNRASHHTFPDVEFDRWSNQQIATMQRAGIVQGDFGVGTFRPGDSITRGEFATIAMRFDRLTPDATHNFSDVSGHWAETSIASAVQRGWIVGYPDGTFRPDQQITRVEAMTLINRVLGRNVDSYGLYWDIVIDWPDLPQTHWGFYQVMEATISHNHERRHEGTANNVENWTGAGADVDFGEMIWTWNEYLGIYVSAGNV